MGANSKGWTESTHRTDYAHCTEMSKTTFKPFRCALVQILYENLQSNDFAPILKANVREKVLFREQISFPGKFC